MRGFFGIGIYNPKSEVNIGSLWRTAQNLNASFIFTIGKRYKRESSDTTKAFRHVPLYHYSTFEEFEKSLPFDTQVVLVEQDVKANNLIDFYHPERVAYVLGAEDYGFPKEILKGHNIVQIPSQRCLNVAIAGSIVLYDRIAKRLPYGREVNP